MGIIANTISTLEVNFCLDKNYIEITKHNESVVALSMKLDMQFGNEDIIVQEYDYVFLGEKLKIYPGNEIEDFFPEMDLSSFVNDKDTIAPYRLFPAGNIQIQVKELDADNFPVRIHTLTDVKFLPGKKPKAFPFLTNGKIRSVYSNSYVSVSVLKDDFENQSLNDVLDSSTTESTTVVNVAFSKKNLSNSLDVIDKQGLSLQPVVDAQSVINVIFQNQNKCPDWFSFSGEWEEHSDITHTISEDVTAGRFFKSNTSENQTLKLNTGWFFEEEIEILKELIVSPICYAYLKGKWTKIIPVSKKPLPYDSLRNINSQIVEFKVVEYER